MEIYFKRGNQSFNFRVAAIIKKDNQILVSKFNDTYTLPGGRVRFGETTEKGLQRAIFSELGVIVSIQRLISINENFFTYGEDDYHEVLFTYLCDIEEDIDTDKVSNEKESYHFMKLQDLLKANLKPAFLINDLKQLPHSIHHNVNK